ncbi:MAG: phage holin family protein [Gammaproteobacteria bacterium]|nr:hypothetical protein [Rhodocyclaceae bacterium]MBU3908856.1 phage holin family protein [Gammaproteobacteria bacterium]MBU3987723.1 phage holin family protein [Gammaproteobacteria bacterium]MBU4003691.1 phage holin family protein [Gammaproteobacteria bacterium]MBU4021805.1 phage holin family protein [Gammaproteobacteria bacterium]
MPEKDPTNFALVTYTWVILLSAWGGAVSWLRKRNSGDTRPFNIMELIGELMTSAFAGILTFWLCEHTGTPPLVTAALVGISGHMGSRAIYIFERWAEARFGKVTDKTP